MDVIMWRWASEFAGLPLSAEQYLYGAEELGDGFMHSHCAGNGFGDGTYGDMLEEYSYCGDGSLHGLQDGDGQGKGV